MDFVHPNAPAGGCGPGNSRVPGTLCAHASARPLTHVDAPPGGQAHWYDNLPGAAFARHVMAVFEAIGDSYRYLPRALLDATGMELHAILEGILPSLVMMVAILALTTAIGAAAGAALGALAFGVGAVPGAAAGAGVGLEVGTVLLEWLGLAFLVVYIGKSLLKGTKMAASAVALAWHSADQPQALRDASRITAARELANAVAEVFRGVLQGIVAFLLAKGVAAAGSRVPELVANLRKSKLGASFATWVEKNWAALVENPKLKETTQPNPVAKPPADSRGWQVGDDIYAPTKSGNEPAWSTVRSRFWKNESVNSQNGTWNAEQLDRMSQGLAPQRYNFDKGGIESMELSHEPIPFRDGGTELVPRWPQDHAAVDPFRRPGY